MAIFTKKTPWEKEWQDLLKKRSKVRFQKKRGTDIRFDEKTRPYSTAEIEWDFKYGFF